VKTSYYYYTSTGYKTADTLLPGVGYWVKVTPAGTLILDVNQTSAQPGAIVRAPEPESYANYNSMSIEQTCDGIVSKGTLYFTGEDEQSSHLEMYGIPPSPPSDVFDVRFSSNRIVESFSVDGSIRHEIPFAIQGSGGRTRVAWTMAQKGAVRYAILQRKAHGAIVNHPLSASGSLTLDVETGDAFSLKTAGLPAEYALLQNYPNPFNPTTNIRFSLPEQSNVTLKIFNILGQAVATPLLNESLDRGDHAVVVDAKNWVSGVYFYQLSAGTYTSVKKMTLLK
jgi:hypothetical protein